MIQTESEVCQSSLWTRYFK